MRTPVRCGYAPGMTNEPEQPATTPRPGDANRPETDPDTEHNPVTPPNPAETPPTR